MGSEGGQALSRVMHVLPRSPRSSKLPEMAEYFFLGLFSDVWNVC